MESYEKELLHVLLDMLNESAKIINEFPTDYIPDNTVGEELKDKNPMALFGSSENSQISEDEKRNSQIELQETLTKIMGSFPENMLAVYINCSLIISHCLRITSEKNPHLSIDHHFSEGRFNEFMKSVMISQSGFNLDEIVGSYDFLDTPLPFKYIVTTFLGPEATKWITADSKDFPGKIQPHETSRVNWHKLRQMEGQIQIESELYQLGKLEPILSKIVVASLWTMKSLATLMNPNVFIAEAKPYVSLMSDGKMTVSQGLNTHTILNYKPHSFIKVINALRAMLDSSIIESHDMMWVATNLAEIRSINQRHIEILKDIEERPEIFLSHRGKDSKAALMNELLKSDSNSIFLDCLSLPLRLINRNFVFKSLVESKKILIIRTENFDTSEWCRKELEIARILEKISHSSFQIYKHLEPVFEEISMAPRSVLNQNQNDETREINWTITRILRDIDSHNGERPNIYGLKQKGLEVDCFDEIQSFLADDFSLNSASGELISNHRPSKIHQINKLFETVFDFLRNKFGKENHLPFSDEDLLTNYLAVTAQYVIALLSDGSGAYDKMVTRKYISIANSLCTKILDLTKTVEPYSTKEKLMLELTKFMCSSIALELSDKDYDSIIGNGILDIIKAYGIYRDGLILLDVRKNLDMDNPFLLLLVDMVFRKNIGTVGILQSAVNPIHESSVDGLNLEVIPCVTFHEGMEKLFQEEVNSQT